MQKRKGFGCTSKQVKTQGWTPSVLWMQDRQSIPNKKKCQHIYTILEDERQRQQKWQNRYPRCSCVRSGCISSIPSRGPAPFDGVRILCNRPMFGRLNVVVDDTLPLTHSTLHRTLSLTWPPFSSHWNGRGAVVESKHRPTNVWADIDDLNSSSVGTAIAVKTKQNVSTYIVNFTTTWNIIF